MGAIWSNIQTVLTNVWSVQMENELLPGITIKQLFIWSWIAVILVNFIRTMIFNGIDYWSDED